MIGTNIAIDFGSSSTELYVQGKGVILDEPTMIAVDVETGMPIAIGNAAYTINGRTDDSIEVISPIVGGIISNYTMAEHILKYYLQKILKNSVIKPNVVISIPSGATGLERRTFLDVVTAAGAGRAADDGRLRGPVRRAPRRRSDGLRLPWRTAYRASGSRRRHSRPARDG